MRSFWRLGISVGLALLFSIATPARAGDKPIQLALFAPVQIFPDTDGIAGLRLNLLYGRNLSVTGLDIGLVNHTTSGDVKGVQWGAVGYVEGGFVGWQSNIANIVNRDFTGLQFGAFNYAERLEGLQLGVVNYAESVDGGLQIGLANIITEGGWLPFMIIVNGGF